MSTHATVAKTVSVKPDSGMRDRIKHLADAQNRTTHWVMCEAIAQYAVREEKHESSRQAMLAAWQEYQDTGLHATGEDVDAWLASRRTNNELPAPACHP